MQIQTNNADEGLKRKLNWIKLDDDDDDALFKLHQSITIFDTVYTSHKPPFDFLCKIGDFEIDWLVCLQSLIKHTFSKLNLDYMKILG